MEIKVLGPGCARCEKTARLVKEAVEESNLRADIEKITNAMDIAGYGVFGTPAVIIDGEVKCVGKVPDKDEIKKWISVT